MKASRNQRAKARQRMWQSEQEAYALAERVAVDSLPHTAKQLDD